MFPEDDLHDSACLCPTKCALAWIYISFLLLEHVQLLRKINRLCGQVSNIACANSWLEVCIASQAQMLLFRTHKAEQAANLSCGCRGQRREAGGGAGGAIVRRRHWAHPSVPGSGEHMLSQGRCFHWLCTCFSCKYCKTHRSSYSQAPQEACLHDILGVCTSHACALLSVGQLFYRSLAWQLCNIMCFKHSLRLRGNGSRTAVITVKGIADWQGDMEKACREVSHVLQLHERMQMQAKAAVDADQRLSFSVDLAPSQPRNAGFVRASGTIPLRPAAAAPAASTSTPSSPQSECTQPCPCMPVHCSIEGFVVRHLQCALCHPESASDIGNRQASPAGIIFSARWSTSMHIVCAQYQSEFAAQQHAGD